MSSHQTTNNNERHRQIIKDVPLFDEESTDEIAIDILDKHCYLIRNALNQREQMSLFGDIQERSKQHTDNNSTNNKSCMYPSPKTLIYDGNRSTITFDMESDDSFYNRMIQKVNYYLKRTLSHDGDIMSLLDVQKKTYKRIIMGAIRYSVPNGSFPEHVDHCNSHVYLLSLGCTANFVLRGPSMTQKMIFEFKSGDVLVFDASTNASIRHGVVNVDHSGSCPKDLANVFEVLRDHRVGVQCRVKA